LCKEKRKAEIGNQECKVMARVMQSMVRDAEERWHRGGSTHPAFHLVE